MFNFIKLFFLFILVICNLNAELIEEIELSKDEIKYVDILIGQKKKTLSFRWTLYKDNGLVMHIKYDNLPHQSILYKNHANSYKVMLSTSLTSYMNPYLIIYFIDFDDKNRKAKFRYHLFKFNENENVEVM